MFGEGNGTPLQYSCLENPVDRGAWWATVHGVAKSRTRLSDFTFTFHFHALEKEMATHSSVLAWRIPGTAEPGGLPSMGSHRVRHDWSDLAAAAAVICWYLRKCFSTNFFIYCWSTAGEGLENESEWVSRARLWRTLWEVLRNMNYVAWTEGSHWGIWSKRRTLSTLNFRNMSLPGGRRMDGVRKSLKADF